MMPDAINDMKCLQERLVSGGFGLSAELTPFRSGAAMLDVRGGGRAFVMAYSPGHGFGVDELHANDGFVSVYRFVFTDFESAARQLWTMATAATSAVSPRPALSLIVLQSGHLEVAKDFYELLGLSFVQEQHGKGPRHYSASLGAVVMELYPRQGSDAPARLRIGFHVPSLDQTLDALRRRKTRIVQEAKDSIWGRRAIVEDPDGNCVELTAFDQGTPVTTSGTPIHQADDGAGRMANLA